TPQPPTSTLFPYTTLFRSKLDSLLPGTPTIPEQIAADKQPYYNALEAADREWTNQKIDVSKLEAVVEAMLSQQLINAVKQAAGRSEEHTSELQSLAYLVCR